MRGELTKADLACGKYMQDIVHSNVSLDYDVSRVPYPIMHPVSKQRTTHFLPYMSMV